MHNYHQNYTIFMNCKTDVRISVLKIESYIVEEKKISFPNAVERGESGPISDKELRPAN